MPAYQQEREGTLFVCATPIGNLGDVSERLRETLAEVDVIACEDTRRTRRLLTALEIRTPDLVVCDEHRERAAVGPLIARLQAGAKVALVSDAGTPSLADPGVVLVRAAHEAGVPVVAIPGPSAITAAVSVSGMGGSRYTFVGFLPRSAQQLSQLIREYEADVLVAFESPQRISASLAAIAEIQPTRSIVVCRELTKRFEQVRAGVAVDLAAAFDGEVRGELVLVFAPLVSERPDVDRSTLTLARELLEAGLSMKEVSKLVGRHSGVGSRALYEALLSDR